MKKTTIRAIAFAICLTLLYQSPVCAQNASSEAEVEFNAGSGPTYPVYPEDPEVEGNGGPVEGSLAIVSVSHFDFGTISVGSGPQSLDAETVMPNIQVVDLRGTSAGWKVSATMSRFSSGPEFTLPGAAIRIEDGRPNSTSVSDAPEQVEDMLLTSDKSPVLVLSAANGAGAGLWVMRWYPEQSGTYVTLEIPAGAATTGSHTATITWILEDTV